MATELNRIVHEIVIDDRGAKAGAAGATAAFDAVADGATRAATGLSALDQAAGTTARGQISALRALDGWRRQADQNYAATQKLAKAQQDLDRALQQGLVTEREVGQILDQLRGKFMGVAEAANENAKAMEASARSAAAINQRMGIGGGEDYSARAADIEAYGRALDELQSRFDPVFAAQNRYQQELDAAADAHRRGALTAEQYAAAVSRIDAAMSPAAIEAQKVAASVKQQDQALDQLRMSLDAGYAANKRFAQAQEILDAGLQRGAITAEEHSRAMIVARERADSMNRSGMALAGSFGGLRGAFQNLGWQIADVATQLSMGANAVQVFAIQGGQLLGMFGGVGAIAGAAVTVIGSLAYGFIGAGDAAKDAKGPMDALGRTIAGQIDDVDELAAKYRTLTEEQANLERVNLLGAQSAAIREMKAAVDALKEGIADSIPRAGWLDFRDFADELKPVNDILDRMRAGSLGAEEGMGQLERALRRTGISTGFTTEQVQMLAGELAEKGSAVADVNERLKILSDVMRGAGQASGDLAATSSDLASFIDRAASAENAAPGMRALAEAMRLVEGVKLTGQAVDAFMSGLLSQEQFDTVYAAIDRFITEGDSAFDKGRKGADDFAKKLESLTDALDPVGAATRNFARDMAILEKAGKGNSDLADELVRRYGEDLTAAYEKVEGEAGKYREVLTDTTERMTLENDVLRLQVAGREEQAAWLQEEARLRDQLGPLYDQNADQLRTLWEENRRLSESYKAQGEAAKEAAKEVERQIREQERMVDSIVQYGGDRLTDGLFDKTRDGWRDMLSGMLEDLARFLTRAAVEAALRPVAVRLAGSMTSGGTAAASAAGGGSGGFGMSNLSDVGSILRGGNGTGSLMPGVDSWAQSTFGWGQIGLSSVGAAGVGSVGGGAAASLGVAAVPGGITNAAAAAPGLMGGGSALAGFSSFSNVLGIGGAILPGLISGNYAQAAAGGIGAAIGTAILPGIGTMVGGMLGNLVGSMFGGKDPHPAAGVDIVIGPDGTLTTGRVSSKHMGTEGVEKVAGGYIATMNAVLEALGISGGRNIGHGASIGFDQRANKWAVHNGGQPVAEYDSPEAAFDDLAMRIIKGMDPETIGEDIGTAIRNSAATTLDGLADDIRFAQGRNAMFDKPAEAIGPFETALRELEALFATATARAEALGLSVEEMAADFEGAKRRVAADFDEQVADQILALTDPAALELKNLATTFEALRREAEAVGGSLDQVNRLYDLQRQRIEEQATLARIAPQIEAVNVARAALMSAYEAERGELEAMVGTMDGLARSLRQSRLSLLIDPNLSPLSPEARMDEAARQFADISSRARLGDTAAMEQLPEISRQYLEVARGFYASSEDYARLFDAVSATLQDTETVAERHLRIAEQQLSALNSQAAQLGLINTGIQSFASALAALGVLTGGTGRNWGANPALNQQIAAVLPNFTGDFGQGALSAYMQSASQTEKDKVNAILAGAGIQGRFADGGLAMPGLALVGERGPEVVDFRAPGRVYTNSELASALNQGGSDNGEMVRELKATNRILTAGLTAMREELAATRAEMADVRAKLGRAA